MIRKTMRSLRDHLSDPNTRRDRITLTRILLIAAIAIVIGVIAGPSVAIYLMTQLLELPPPPR